MYVLGIHGGQRREEEDGGDAFSMHDGAAVLVADGTVVAAIEEERLNRIKHTNVFPLRAIRFCLEQAGLRLGDVDRIAVNFSEATMDGYLALE
ncbi:MAG TPA: carbamoyltransferase N-terminal domain-containing protein, partial [Thermoanaerobaculia bacterium]